MNLASIKSILLLGFLVIHLNPSLSQSVCIDSILINGAITKYMTHSDFIGTGIKIDSIVSAKPMDSFDPDSMIYVGSSLFWYDSKRGICEARSIRFDKIVKLQLGRFLVNKLTTQSDARKMFPVDCETTKPAKIFQRDEIFQICSIPVSDKKGQVLGMKIIFFFKDSLLYRIDFWEPN